jgi:fused signal recognition particle receptor
VEAFGEVIKIDGVFLTKYDSSAKGGVVAALGKTYSLPVCFVGTGEKYDDIEVFSEENYVKNLFE